MAVVSGTVSSSPVGPAATVVQAPADECPPNGAGIMGLNGKWVLDPGESFIVQALGVLNTTGNIDWSAAGYFSFTCTASATLTLTFGVTGALTTPSFSLGQLIKVRIISASGTAGTIAWPNTIAWIGTTTAGAATHATPVPVTGSVQIDVSLVCTGTGSAPTFDGIYTTGA